MSEPLYFQTREDFRKWLSKNCQSHEGVWLLFFKTKEQQTLKASEALEEALCYGWIDGLMKKIDDDSYKKYFAARQPHSKWSLKNKEVVESLEQKGIMTDFGRIKIEEAKKNGQWDLATRPSAVTEEQINEVVELLKKSQLAYTNFLNMSLSVQKTYTRAYFDAKTDAGRAKRLTWMIERLEKNLKPM
jgi:uncharacterized protein YdeI (YjbR/CyaY-like superfamily)